MIGRVAIMLIMAAVAIGIIVMGQSALDRCDTEVLAAQVELNEARDAYWRDIAACKEQGCTP